MAGAVELAAQFAQQCGLARAGVAAEQGEGLGVFDQRGAQGAFGAQEVFEGIGGRVHGEVSGGGFGARVVSVWICRVR